MGKTMVLSSLPFKNCRFTRVPSVHLSESDFPHRALECVVGDANEVPCSYK